MNVLVNIDPWLRVQAVFDASFRTLFPLPGVCRQVGFTGISERLADPPGWFLWLDDNSGAYSLELIEARHIKTGDLNACIGTFTVRYFPGIDDRCLIWHSSEERSMRTGPFFDATGTPNFMGLDRIVGNLFLAGYLDVAVHLNGNAHEFRLRSEEVAASSHVVPARLPAWSRESRRVHDWRVSWTLVDKLFLAVGHHFRRVPSRVTIQFKGMGEETSFQELTVMYREPDGSCSHVFPVGPKSRVLSKEEFGISGSTNQWINWEWWHAADLKPGEGEAGKLECGCMAHQH